MSTVPCLVLVHAVWATQQRTPLLAAENDALVLDSLGGHAKKLGCDLVAGGCWDDHVHVLLRVAPAVSVATVIGHLKGGSAFDLNRHPRMRARLRWQRGYWAQSIGSRDVECVCAYVVAQREHHALSATGSVDLLEP